MEYRTVLYLGCRANHEAIMTRIANRQKTAHSQRLECPICKAGFWATPKSAEIVAEALERHVAGHARIAADGKPGKPDAKRKADPV